MPRQENQKLRILYLYELLYRHTDEQHPLSREALCARLERDHGIHIERKTFYDDLQQLTTFGAGIQKGVGRGCYFLGERRFEMPELHLLVDAIQSSQFITEKKSRELIEKLTSLCSHAQGEILKKQVFLATRNKTVNESIYYNIDAIYRGLSAGKLISFCYYGWNLTAGKLTKTYRREGARYLVAPLSVVWDDEKYYLIALDIKKDALRHYRIDKMELIEVEKKAAPPTDKQFDGGSYAAKFFSMYGGTEQQVTLRFQKQLLGVAIDRFGKTAMLRPDDEEHFLLIANVSVSPMFFGFLFSLGEGVQILSPDEAVKDFKKMLAQVKKLYR